MGLAQSDTERQLETIHKLIVVVAGHIVSMLVRRKLNRAILKELARTLSYAAGLLEKL